MTIFDEEKHIEDMDIMIEWVEYLNMLARYISNVDNGPKNIIYDNNKVQTERPKIYIPNK